MKAEYIVGTLMAVAAAVVQYIAIVNDINLIEVAEVVAVTFLSFLIYPIFVILGFTTVLLVAGSLDKHSEDKR